jgi:hypothetical protein
MQDAFDKARLQTQSVAKQRAMIEDVILDGEIAEIVKGVPELVRKASELGDSTAVLYLGAPGSSLVDDSALEKLSVALRPFRLSKTSSKFHVLISWCF